MVIVFDDADSPARAVMVKDLLHGGKGGTNALTISFYYPT